MAATESRTRRYRTLGALSAAVVVAVVVAGRSPRAGATSRVPTEPAEVLERVPATNADPRSREIAELRRILGENPANLRAALRLARLDIQLSRERSDPRYLGRAQAALAPWWTPEVRASDDAPAQVLVLRATIEQSLHDFDAALLHLDSALAATPDDAQAWLTRAVVLTVLARYDEARASCARVRGLVDPIAATVCETQVQSLTGQAKEAHARLASLLAAEGRASPETREWALSSLGEYAARAGDPAAAELHYREALALAKGDAWVRGALADLLTDLGRFPEAASLVRGYEDDDGLLLRLAIAERRGKLPGAAEHTALLDQRFEASRARGDVVHRREEARFWLELKDDAPRALALARANWDVQKEPWDARILLATAGATGEPGAASVVLEHLDHHKLEEPAIARLRKELGR
jgi:tetratricopeptide (TPR) repeat protein